MTLRVSPVISAESVDRGVFSARRVEPGRFEGLAGPVLGLDHYRMKAITFAPHPHAGFAALSYIFEDSKGALRNRDSLGNDFDVGPGELVWTQAGTGVVHDERPAIVGDEVHGLQIFVNSAAANKMRHPRVLRLKAGEVPGKASGDGQIRVLAGSLDGLTAPIDTDEPFRFVELAATTETRVSVPLPNGWSLLAYAVSGRARLFAGIQAIELKEAQAVALQADGEEFDIAVDLHGGSRVIVLSGPVLEEPVVQYGPFIMNDAAQVDAAIKRYQNGEMGRLATLSS